MLQGESLLLEENTNNNMSTTLKAASRLTNQTSHTHNKLTNHQSKNQLTKQLSDDSSGIVGAEE